MLNRNQDAVGDDSSEKKKSAKGKLTPEQKAIRNKQKVERAAAAQVRRAESQVKRAAQAVQNRQKNEEKKQKEKAKKAASKIKAQEKKVKQKEKKKEQQAANKMKVQEKKLRQQEAKAQRKAELEARTPLQKSIDRTLKIKKFLPLVILLVVIGVGALVGLSFGTQIAGTAKTTMANIPFLSGGEEEGENAKAHGEEAADEEEKEPVEGIYIGGTAVLREYFAPALAAYMEVEEKEAKAFCSSKNYNDGYKNLIAGDLQILFSEAPTDKETELALKAGLELKSVPILNGGLVFLINEANPVKDLTLAQIQGIYDGTISNWQELGGEDVPIIAYQRGENTGGQSGLYKYVLSKDKIAKVSRKMKLSSTADLAEAVAAEKGAIGYTYYYYVNKLETSEGIKLAAVNSVEPSGDTIGAGQYPLTTYTYAVVTVPQDEVASDSKEHAEEPEEAPSEEELKEAQKLKTEQLEQLRANLRFIQWILREDGQALAEKKGFVMHND